MKFETRVKELKERKNITKQIAVIHFPHDFRKNKKYVNFGHISFGIFPLGQSCKMSQIWQIYPCKKLEVWGKKSGRTQNFAKSSIVLGKFEQLI